MSIPRFATTRGCEVAAMTAGAVKDALHRRYNKPSQGKPGEQYVCIEEARSGVGFDGNAGQCDFLAINTWQSRGMTLIGHEVKVSRSDWKAELAQPEKAERFAKFCRLWYVVVPSALAKEIKHEVPPAWGLMSVSDAGNVREVCKPEPRRPSDVPAWWWVGWLAQIDRQHKRRLPRLIREGLADERELIKTQAEQDVAREQWYADERHQNLLAQVERFRELTGIDVEHAWRHDFDRLPEAWRLVKSCHIDVLAKRLRDAVDAIDAIRSDGQEVA